jgi:hypothetical protein
MSERTSPSTSPAATQVVVVRGLDNTCWKCQQPTMCVVAAHADGAQRSDDWVWFEDKHALTFARGLLPGAGQAHLAETIKPCFSRAASGTYLANGCEHCDSIQGDWPIGRMISEWGFAAPLTELPILATATVARAVWHDVLARQGMKRLGYPMKWEDLD